MVMGTLSFLMISNVPYPVVPTIGLRSVRGVVGLAVLIGGVSLLIFGRLEYFFPLAVLYVAFVLVRAVVWAGGPPARGSALDNGEDEDEARPASSRESSRRSGRPDIARRPSRALPSVQRRRRRRRRGRGDRPGHVKPPQVPPGEDSDA